MMKKILILLLSAILLLAFTALNCNGLKKVVIPDSVNSIGDSAFAFCPSLIEIAIPDSATRIGDHAFESCWNLGEIIIPDGVKIGTDAFNGTLWIEMNN